MRVSWAQTQERRMASVVHLCRMMLAMSRADILAAKADQGRASRRRTSPVVHAVGCEKP
jgi:hypothetical protein